MATRAPLPIDALLLQVRQSLNQEGCLVLVAEPGAGKTTRIPPCVLELVAENQKVLVLEPRRVAARAAARRVAYEMGEPVGRTVGYKVRFEEKCSASTRILFLTEGLLTRLLKNDPELDGVGAVILDEFHERSIHADLAIAYLKEVREVLRPDLKVVAMSATVDADRIAAYLDGCPVLRSKGRLFDVDKTFLEEPDDRRPFELAVSGVKRALRDPTGGDVLVFLPGAGDIRRAQEVLAPIYADRFDVLPLYGELSAAEQDRAIQNGPRPKIVLATNIAETSLTIDGVSTVVDTGRVRRPIHDPRLGFDRLEMVRICRASADQRAGRAGRQAAGRVFRMWTAHDDRHLRPFETPDIARIDLAPTILHILAWNSADPKTFDWFDAPSDAAMTRALSLLRALGALPHDGFHLTELGQKLSELPVHPRLGAVLLRAQSLGVLKDAALMCALLSERDLVRRRPDGALPTRDESDTCDLLWRLDRLDRRSGFSSLAVARAKKAAQQLERAVSGPPSSRSGTRDEALRRSLLAGFSDRVSRRRPGTERFVSATGRGLVLSPDSVAKSVDLLIAVEVDDSKKGAESMIRLASGIDEAWLFADFAADCDKGTEARFNVEREAVEVESQTRFRAIVLSAVTTTNAEPQVYAETLEREARRALDRVFVHQDRVESLLARISLVRRLLPNGPVPAFGRDALPELLPLLCAEKRSFEELRKADVAAAIRTHLGWEASRALKRLAPESLDLAGRSFRLRYDAEIGPVLSIKLQRLFGVRSLPRLVDGRAEISVELLAPNGRPVQLTRDLEGFWERTYPEVRKQLRGRYPRHAWPEDPNAPPPNKKR